MKSGPMLAQQRWANVASPTHFLPTANVEPTLYRLLYDIGSMLARRRGDHRRMVVHPISAQCFFEIRSNVHPITLAQRYWANIGPDFIKTFCRCRPYNHSPTVNLTSSQH